MGEVSRRLKIPRSTIRDWAEQPEPARTRGECPICEGVALDAQAYSSLLGFYLGDGHISRAARFYALRIYCDAKHPDVVDDVARQLNHVRPGARVFFINQPGCTVVQAHWKHWPCLFPQHGSGLKHQRAIMLEPWQERIVTAQPAAFLRGLFHSDGSRSRNWTQRVIAGQMKRYDYPRWQFTNSSPDIRALCCWALDLVDVLWRQSNWKTISVSRREGVARLDELIGLKS